MHLWWRSRSFALQIYEEYKTVPGKEMNAVLLENKAILKKKKLQARDVALEINKFGRALPRFSFTCLRTKLQIDENIADMKAKCSYFNEDFSKLEEQAR